MYTHTLLVRPSAGRRAGDDLLDLVETLRVPVNNNNDNNNTNNNNGNSNNNTSNDNDDNVDRNSNK